MLSESDYLPLSTFSLAWRFTDERWDELEEDVLALIRPLTPQAAQGLSADGKRRCLERGTGWASRIPADAPRALGRDWLQTLPIPPEREVIVSWADDLAVGVPWRVFVDYWDAFCYPSSDDVSTWSPDQTWVLCFHHSAGFFFRPAAA